MKQTIAPKWVLWISFVILGMGGLFYIILLLSRINDLTINPGLFFGELLGVASMIYLIIYIPMKAIYLSLKETK